MMFIIRWLNVEGMYNFEQHLNYVEGFRYFIFTVFSYFAWVKYINKAVVYYFILFVWF